MKTERIPLLNPAELIKHHFGDVADWKPFYASFHLKFHINRIEDYREHLKFPLPPHRKTVFDFIFLTQGTSIRTKGLDTYTFSKNTFFFLPPYQITTNTEMTSDVTGFYCYFDPEVLTIRFTEKIVNEFSFLQFIGNPIVEVDDKNELLAIFYAHKEKSHKLPLVYYYQQEWSAISGNIKISQYLNIKK